MKGILLLCLVGLAKKRNILKKINLVLAKWKFFMHVDLKINKNIVYPMKWPLHLVKHQLQ
jgi:hypothetical protein